MPIKQRTVKKGEGLVYPLGDCLRVKWSEDLKSLKWLMQEAAPKIGLLFLIQGPQQMKTRTLKNKRCIRSLRGRGRKPFLEWTVRGGYRCADGLPSCGAVLPQECHLFWVPTIALVGSRRRLADLILCCIEGRHLLCSG